MIASISVKRKTPSFSKCFFSLRVSETNSVFIKYRPVQFWHLSMLIDPQGAQKELIKCCCGSQGYSGHKVCQDHTNPSRIYFLMCFMYYVLSILIKHSLFYVLNLLSAVTDEETGDVDKIFILNSYRAWELENGQCGNLPSTTVSKAHVLQQYNFRPLFPICKIWKSDNTRSSTNKDFTELKSDWLIVQLCLLSYLWPYKCLFLQASIFSHEQME